MAIDRLGGGPPAVPQGNEAVAKGRVLSITPGDKAADAPQPGGAGASPAYEDMLATMAADGQRLNRAEMLVLRNRNPQAYEVARQVDETRAQLREKMEADPARASQLARQALDRLSALKTEPDAKTALHNAINDEYRQFAYRFDQVVLSDRKMTPDPQG